MAVIDDKVVAMSFESRKFEEGVSKTISSLDKLKAALHFPNAGKGLADIDAAAKKVDLSHISQGVEKVSRALEAMRLIAIGVMSQLTTQAVRAAGSFVKAFTLDPAKAGFAEYATNLNAVQTILANTQASGAGLKEVNAALEELNAYSDKTIYNFSQMARNIGTFTAAGVDLDTATASIKGIANLAALSGSNAEQASTAMYQLSQAIAAGSVKLMDWNSVVNAGMGGTVFQRALALTGEHMGKLKKGTVELVGPMKNVKIAGESFRNSLSAPGKDGWLTSDVLTKTLKMFTSDMTDAELAAEGWNKEQIKAIQTQANTAMLAATNVKTLQQVIDVARETAGSGWAKTWQIVFGDFMEAKQTFTRLSTAINGFINDSARARNNVLADWKELGGRTVLIESIARAFHNLGMILKPIKDAFRQFFPAKTASDLMYLTQQFEAFTFKLRPSVKTIFQIRHTFAGLFAVLDIGWEIIKGVVGVFMDLVGATGAGSGGFLSFTNNIGNTLVAFHKWLIEGGRLAAFFDKLTAVLKAPIDLFRALGKALKDLFSGISFGGFSKEIDGVTQAMTPFQKVMEGVATVWGKFLDAIANSGNILKPALDAVLAFIHGLGSAIGNISANMNFDAILAVIRTGFLGALVLMFKKFLGKGSGIDQITKGFGGGILSNISGSFDALQGSLKALQTNIKADTLQKIAIAVALLTASIVALSFVDPDKLKSSLTAMAVAFGQLLGAMAILEKISTSAGFLKMPFIAASLILLAGAINLLSIAVVILAQLSWEQLAKGLGGVAVLLVGISKAVVPLSANSSGMIRAGIGIAAIAAAMLLLATAVRIMGTMNLADLAKGLGGITISLGIMVAAVFAMSKIKGLNVSSVQLIAMAIALNLLALAVRQFATMSLEQLAKGLGSMAISLGIVAAALFAMSKIKGLNVTSVQLIAVAIALNLIAKAIATMAGMSARQLAKGLIAIAAALGILGVAMFGFSKVGMGGAVALGVAAGALALLIPAIVLLGKQSWTTLLKGLVGLGIALAAIAIAGALMTPAIPGLMGLGVALLLIGGAFALVGAGIFLISAGFSALIVALPAGVGVLVAAFVELVEGLIDNTKLLVLGLLEIVQAFAATAPKFAVALGKILDSLLDIVIQSMPKIAMAFQALLTTVLGIFDRNRDRIIQAGFDMIMSLLIGIRNNIPKLVTLVADIITRFLLALANKGNEILTAGTKLLISLLKGISDRLNLIIKAVTDIVTKFITELGLRAKDIIIAGGKFVVSIITGITNSLGNIITAAGNLIVKFIEGLGKKSTDIITAGKNFIIKFIKGLGKAATEIAKACADTITDFVVALDAAIKANKGEFEASGRSIAWNIADGLSLGLLGKGRELATQAYNLGKSVVTKIAEGGGIKSPSKATIETGKFMAEGLILGLEQNTKGIEKSALGIGNSIIGAFNNVFETASPSKVMYKIGQFVVQGFANGLTGSAEDIRTAFAAMKQRLKEDIVSVREDMAAEQDRLAEMLEEKQDKLDEINAKKWKKVGDKAKAIADVQKKYAEAIKESEDAIKSNESTLSALTATQKVLTKSLQDEKDKLIKLSIELDKVNEKLKEAQENLVRIKEERDAFAKEQGDKYAALPEISEPLTEEIKSARENIQKEQTKLDKILGDGTKSLEDVAAARVSLAEAQTSLDKLVEGKVLTAEGTSVDIVKTYLQDLTAQQTAVAAFGKTLEQLRAMNLDEKTYRMLVEEGVAAQGFAEALLAGGTTAVKAVGKLDESIAIEANKLAVSSAAYLYAAGIKSAEGLIDGLVKGIKGEKGKKQLETEINKLAKFIIATMRKGLKEKSPSQEFMTIGELAMKGLALGFKNSSQMVAKSVDDAAQNALSAMRKTMRDISSAVTDELNPKPVITPVLDLTQIRSQAIELSNLIPITAAASYGQAAAISAEQNAAMVEDIAVAPGGTSVKFEQNNYSPEALTEVEIYRQTRNQLSQLKSVLAT